MTIACALKAFINSFIMWCRKQKIIIGPLPPSWGGARVSFKLFYNYLKEVSDQSLLHYDLPIRYNRDKNPPGGVNHFKTFIIVLSCLFRIPFVSSVIVFGSRNFCFSYGIILLVVSRIFRKPFYIRLFGGHPAQNSIFRMPIAGSMVTRFMSFADKIIVQTHVGVEEFPQHLRSNISVIVGYRPGAGSADEIKDPADSVVRFAYTGAVSWSKGIGHLLDAFVKVSKGVDADMDIELHLYGSGEKELVDKCNSLDKVFYHGRVDNSVLRRDLSRYDVFIFPTLHDSEGHPGSVIEALMAGLPIIASNWSGINEVIGNKENGLLVEPGNTKQLADAMEKLIKDVGFRNQLAEQALESSTKFDAAHVLPKLAEAVGIKISYENA